MTTAEELLLLLVGVKWLSHLECLEIVMPGSKVVSSEPKLLRKEVGILQMTISVLGITRCREVALCSIWSRLIILLVREDALWFSTTNTIMILLLVMVIVEIIDKSNNLFRSSQIKMGGREIGNPLCLINKDLCFQVGRVSLPFGAAGVVGVLVGWVSSSFPSLPCLSIVV